MSNKANLALCGESRSESQAGSDVVTMMNDAFPSGIPDRYLATSIGTMSSSSRGPSDLNQAVTVTNSIFAE
jgi:hypothetical protein